ncbi:hypothetical protein Micbo1qcDRAFT_199005 [Microdochium bolleyi]|uniref:BTB domain-containing protein n=1 Tax=Microdochium bolleyi TaxID=196109 RepID=A0A136IIW3_9PEZI|nr:hypothetical protein Micbo1qcDRAFT_199005 [Microdochium bolleyi]
MEEPIIVFDVEGDLVLSLHNPDAPFAVWREDGHKQPSAQQSARSSSPRSRLEESKKKKKKKMRKQEAGTDHVSAVPLVDDAMCSTSLQRTTQPSSVVTDFSDSPNLRNLDSQPIEPEHTKLEPQKPIVKLRLSSKHLSLASPYFRKLLSCGWLETKDLKVEAADWDRQALIVLMSIIHGRNKDVPLHVDIELLSKIAVLVDYYQCFEAVLFIAAKWLETLRWEVPSTAGRDLVLWVLASWTYQDPNLFETVTRTAIKTSKYEFSPLGLPIPQIIVDRRGHQHSQEGSA